MTTDPICSLCGRPVAEDQDCVDTDHQGLVHGKCWDAKAAEDPAGDESDFWFEHAGDR